MGLCAIWHRWCDTSCCGNNRSHSSCRAAETACCCSPTCGASPSEITVVALHSTLWCTCAANLFCSLMPSVVLPGISVNSCFCVSTKRAAAEQHKKGTFDIVGGMQDNSPTEHDLRAASEMIDMDSTQAPLNGQAPHKRSSRNGMLSNAEYGAFDTVEL